MEIVFSIVAWVGVMLFQAVVHYSFVQRRRNGQVLEAEETSDSAETESRQTQTTDTKNESKSSQTSCPNSPSSVREHAICSLSENSYIDSGGKKPLVDNTTLSLDGDEPEEFYQLLSQTGSEMARSWHAHETLIQQQLDEHHTNRG